MSLITFGGQQVTFGGQVVLAPFDALKIPDLKVLISAKRQAIQADNTVNSTIKNWAPGGLQNITGSNKYITNAINGFPAIQNDTNNEIIIAPASAVIPFTAFVHYVATNKLFADSFQWWFGKNVNSGDRIIFYSSVDTVNSKVFFNIFVDNSAGIYYASIFNEIVNYGEQITLGITYDGITVKAFLDGVLVSVGVNTSIYNNQPVVLSSGGLNPINQKIVSMLWAESAITDQEMMQLHLKSTQTGMI